MARIYFLKAHPSCWPNVPQWRAPVKTTGAAAAVRVPARKTVAPWPLWAEAMREMKTDGELGVGDTVERLHGEFGSDTWKTWHAETFGVFKPCKGCRNWKASWNGAYRY